MQKSWHPTGFRTDFLINILLTDSALFWNQHKSIYLDFQAFLFQEYYLHMERICVISKESSFSNLYVLTLTVTLILTLHILTGQILFISHILQPNKIQRAFHFVVWLDCNVQCENIPRCSCNSAHCPRLLHIWILFQCSLLDSHMNQGSVLSSQCNSSVHSTQPGNKRRT